MYKYLAVLKNWIFDYFRVKMSPLRKKKIHGDFCIISNNCWAGKIYQRYGFQYNTPTVGLYFFADDYIKFLKNLKYYINIPVKIIDLNESKYKNILIKLNQSSVPIGKIDDVEIVFLHYKTPEEAVEKWERRKRRIDYENLIIKFSKMNNCNESHIIEFNTLDYQTKFVFTNKRINIQSEILIDSKSDGDQILDDTKHYLSYLDVEMLLNEKIIVKK